MEPSFRFAVYLLQGTTMEINVINEDVIGKITIALHDVPTCLPPDSPLASQCTQADGLFSKAWHSNSAVVSCIKGVSFAETLVPSCNVIQAQDLVPGHKGRNPEVYAKSVVGEDRLENNTIRHLGKCIILLSDVDQRLLPLTADPKWYNLEGVVFEDGVRKEENFFSKLNMRVSLDGGYHVFDESVQFGSDYRPTAKALWTTMIEVLGLGIINATGLQPMKVREGRETTDAYCVAKYGPKWVKTCTVVDSFDPIWNEQYTWDVYDPNHHHFLERTMNITYFFSRGL
ncbi:hypothetical protein F3Y22_tig00110270pilonHSYRG00001 [Hibiscus syriacus]|uniref:C2 domain-containing protein n=1 Tax=Hibiscus syriacus TaxID=106335 RepID=A0A6A3B5T9_HIBSY|nr:hypothetical protein F3Y22_tig00110270pilonHSYRG00001 [Hibiscus syriacus]